MEIIELDLDNENEMMFKVQIEATRPGDPLCRLMIEGKDISHSIQGNFLPNDEVSITVPPMKGILKEGNYNSYLEVFVDDRVFIPLEMKINFEQTVKVVAESITGRSKSKVRASASLLGSRNTVKRPQKDLLEKNETIQASKIHPAKRGKKEENKPTQLSEQDIMSLVKQLRKKVE